MHSFAPLFAVHIAANVLTPAWIALGFVGMGALIAIGMFRLRDEEIARVGLVTAALFVASSIHIPIPPTSVHLLLNGLAGVVLGRRVAVAVPVGLLLQAILLGHGDLSTLGVNSCVLTLPALPARALFRAILNEQPLGTGVAIFAITWVLAPWLLLIAVPVAFTASRVWRRSTTSHAARAGFAIGAGSVFLTSVLHSFVLAMGGESDWTAVAALSLLAHLPVAIVEGIILAATVDFLIRVKPSLLLPESSAFTPAEKPLRAALPIDPIPR